MKNISRKTRDLNEDLYGEEVTIYFIKKLRQEKKFASADALIAQI
ncbi:MAG: riboflavin kinase, partial [Nitrospirota bacterium]|nr:riboflavin kinase [Nitrospirota bacterium]